MYEFFHIHLAGGEPDANAPFLQLFIRHFLGTGFFEEMVKALPIFALVIAGPLHDPGDEGPKLGSRSRSTAF